MSWSPLINLRWKTMPDGTKVLQQAWGEYHRSYDDGKWYQTHEYVWVDVPTDVDDPKFWSQDEKPKA